MILTKDAFLSQANATLAGLNGALRDALSHHGEPDIAPLARAFKKGGTCSATEFIQTLCPGPLSHIGLAAMVMREQLKARDEVLGEDVSEATVVTGHARVSRSLSVTAPLVVLGDLEVEGVIHDSGPDSTVVVVGRCTAWGLQTSGNFLVLGDLIVRDAIQGVYNDESLVVAGALETRFLDENDHDVSVQGEVRVKHRFKNGRSDEAAASQSSVFLVPSLYDVDQNELHHDELFERISRNEPVFTEAPRPQEVREPDAPTAEELQGIDVAAIAARAPVAVSQRNILYAQRKTGEVWLEGSEALPVALYDGEKFLGSEPMPALEETRASERVTLWRKRGDLFLEIERFEAIVQVHAGYNNGQKTTLRFAFDSADAASREVRRLEARYTGDFLRVTTEIPGRGPLERELFRYENGKSEYTSAIIQGTTLVTRDGHRKTFADEASALLALEEWLDSQRRSGLELKILEWKPFGLLAKR
ncbi:hypothetical protein POL68_17035 [Stigmatella sp. ncwal1]|uniref:Polymer-forming cytoskeletal protein n=1 Tax=Stigmatella ashevillensis TaxID=2995309 RepID=A0ABT5D921_9BACT|nr:hypothetical protein [Stigmatella ashevillena]MDC0710185.1 hypothetical protein [Stigmatella ashevillena]